MSKPEDMFNIIREDRVHTRTDGTTFMTDAYYIIYKHTGEKHFPKTRKYGYSNYKDAVRARTRLFNDCLKTLEETLLGKA